MENKKPKNQYFIRASITDPETGNVNIGLLAWDMDNYIVHKVSRARDWESRTKALAQIRRIITQSPNETSVGVYPPSKIYRIAQMSQGGTTKIDFTFSVLEFDTYNIKLTETDYYCGTVSFENPNIVIDTEVHSEDFS